METKSDRATKLESNSLKCKLEIRSAEVKMKDISLRDLHNFHVFCCLLVRENELTFSFSQKQQIGTQNIAALCALILPICHAGLVLRRDI